MNELFVLDASAVLCLLKNEAGADEVVDALPRSAISAVNLSEVYAKLAEAGGSAESVARAVGVLHLKVEPFGSDEARLAGMLRPVTKRFGLSFGDRACLALARQRRATALTSDAAWANLPDDFQIAVRVVR